MASVLVSSLVSKRLSFTVCYILFFFKQKTAYEMRISDWSSDVCSSDLQVAAAVSEGPVASPWPAETILLAKDLIPALAGRAYFTIPDEHIVWSGKGSDLAGAIARHPMHKLEGF